MNEIKSYRDLQIWRKGIELAKLVYVLTQQLPKTETYGLSDQLRRAAVSVPSNIAEGQARQHTKEFRQSLHMALGSLAELDTQLVLAVELGYGTPEQTRPAHDLITDIRRMTFALLAKLRTRLATDH